MAGFCLRVFLLAAIVGVCTGQTVKAYFKVGGTLVLKPLSVSESITSIVWKYDKNLLAEWVKGSIELTYYSKFKGRSNLNTDTGELVIRNMTASDRAVYSVEINNKVQGQTYQAEEIQDVPEPVVEVRPLACTAASQSCKLGCEGDITEAGPVTYFWKKDDGNWTTSEKDMEISNDEETQRVKTFTCRMKNPVSEKDSKPIDNPLYPEKKPDSGGGNVGYIVGGVFGVIIVGSIIGLGVWKKDYIRENFLKGKSTEQTKTEHNGDDRGEGKGLLGLNTTGAEGSPPVSDEKGDATVEPNGQPDGKSPPVQPSDVNEV